MKGIKNFWPFHTADDTTEQDKVEQQDTTKDNEKEQES